ncbi:hypothetical protein GW17_00059299 [Ensete ventricosum]|nr:hypothetical protein GW17_00059299 [Ensete ventricosum]
MDGFDQTVNVKVIMATNRADTLDPALLRPGRLDRKIEFPLPDRRQKRLVFQTFRLLAQVRVATSAGEPRARATTVRARIDARFSSSLLFFSFPPHLRLPVFSLNRPDFSLNRSPTIDFWRYRSVAGGPHTGNLTDRYVPPVPGGKCRNCKP